MRLRKTLRNLLSIYWCPNFLVVCTTKFPLDGKILLGRQVICLDVHILSLWCMFLFSTFRKKFQKVQFPPSERRQKADKNKKKKKKKKEGKKHSFGKKEKISAKSMDDVDRLFECFKCGVSPPRKLSLSLSLSLSHIWENITNLRIYRFPTLSRHPNSALS